MTVIFQTARTDINIFVFVRISALFIINLLFIYEMPFIYYGIATAQRTGRDLLLIRDESIDLPRNFIHLFSVFMRTSFLLCADRFSLR